MASTVAEALLDPLHRSDASKRRAMRKCANLRLIVPVTVGGERRRQKSVLVNLLG
jgi:hypothetical protein